MTSHTVPRGPAAGITLALGLGLLAGCSGTAPGELGHNQQLLATCPPDTEVNAFVLIDESGSSSSEPIRQERLAVVHDVVQRTAVCGGRLSVQVFSAGSGATASIYSDDLVTSGVTPNARLRQVPELVEGTMTAITAGYGEAVAALPGGGTDVTGLYRLLGEAQVSRPQQRLETTILTDGVTNVGVSIDRVLTPSEAQQLADEVRVPELPGARVTVAGLGRVVGDPLPSAYIEGLVAFYDRLCENTGADECRSVTDGR